MGSSPEYLARPIDAVRIDWRNGDRLGPILYSAQLLLASFVGAPLVGGFTDTLSNNLLETVSHSYELPEIVGDVVPHVVGIATTLLTIWAIAFRERWHHANY